MRELHDADGGTQRSFRRNIILQVCIRHSSLFLLWEATKINKLEEIDEQSEFKMSLVPTEKLEGTKFVKTGPKATS